MPNAEGGFNKGQIIIISRELGIHMYPEGLHIFNKLVTASNCINLMQKWTPIEANNHT